MSPACVLVGLHKTGHLARPIPRCFQELLVDDLHDPQIFEALALRFIVQIGSGQRQQLALTAHTQLVTLANNFLPRVPSNWCTASAKKSRSTTSWPILEFSLSTSAALTCSGAAPQSVNAVELFFRFFILDQLFHHAIHLNNRSEFSRPTLCGLGFPFTVQRFWLYRFQSKR